MRLVCPNCEAKYEVPDDAIPDTGRDVQCANCGHGWFQMRARPASSTALPATAPERAAAEPKPSAEEQPPAPTVDTAPEVTAEVAAKATAEPAAEPVRSEPAPPPVAEPAPEEKPVSSAETAPVPEPDAPAEPAPKVEAATAEPVTESESGSSAAASAEETSETEKPQVSTPVVGDAELEDADLESEDQADPDFPTETGPQPEPELEAAVQANSGVSAYGVDESVLSILREEAEREANARRAEGRALETQTDMGLDAAVAAKSTKPAKASPAVDPAAEAEAKPAPRRDLLPDVEEINSTLRPSETADEGGDDAEGMAPPPQARPGFRSGFVTVLVLSAVGAAIYLAAPQIIDLVPSLDGPLQGYVGYIDGLRLAMDGMMRSATVAINGS